ncbi:MAG TPA: protein kinase [Vicinamibacterales bacterium]|nr:protein kinase [Vicinamibacterales bacterium]
MSSRSLPTRIGRYEVVDRLGAGGMGVLYLARDPLLRRTLAIKVLAVDDDDLRERFAREARSAAALSHTNIVTIFDVGEDGGHPFLAMEYLDGETMAEMIRRKAPVVLQRRLQLLLELCAGLGYAHRLGIIHRDIKPANLMITGNGTLKILDFGLARLTHDNSSGLTQSGALLGTPHYMSPEQIEGRGIDHRSDIFSVGLVLYELLTYKKAYSGEGMHVVLHKITHEAPPPLREVDPTIDPALERIVEKAIERRPEDRYQTLELMSADTTAFLKALADRPDADATVIIRRSDLPEGTPRKSDPGSGGGVRTPSATPRVPNFEGIARRREAQIQLHLDEATRHFNEARYDQAIEQCELAAVLNPEEPRVFELLSRAHGALEDQQIAGWLAEAQARIAEGSLTRAEQLIQQSLERRPAHPQAQTLRRQVQEARREAEQRRERERAVANALERARVHLSEGALEAALRAANEALAFDPAHSDAAALKEQALEALEARRRELEHEQRASSAVAAARSAVRAGDLDGAAALLQAFTPPHPMVEAASAEVQSRIDARQRALEEASSEKGAARAAIAAGDWPAAEAAIQRAATAVPNDTELSSLGRALAQRRAEAEAEARRQLALRKHVEAAERMFADGDLAGAINAAALALELDPQNAAALSTREKAGNALEERRRAEEARVIAERERLAREQAERERLAREQAERERLAREQAERERIAREEAERQRREREEAERLARETVERKERERAEQEQRAREEAAREQAERERLALEQAERERLAHEQAERQRRERAEAERLAREAAEREAAKRAEREAEAREAAERQAKEKAEREAREAAEREAQERARREASEREAREQADRQAREKVEREAREKAEREARERADREAREKAEHEARKKSEREARENADREAREKAAQQQREREEAERRAKVQAERDAREQAERDKSRREQAEREESARLTKEAEAHAKREREEAAALLSAADETRPASERTNPISMALEAARQEALQRAAATEADRRTAEKVQPVAAGRPPQPAPPAQRAQSASRPARGVPRAGIAILLVGGLIAAAAAFVVFRPSRAVTTTATPATTSTRSAAAILQEARRLSAEGHLDRALQTAVTGYHDTHDQVLVEFVNSARSAAAKSASDAAAEASGSDAAKQREYADAASKFQQAAALTSVEDAPRAVALYGEAEKGYRAAVTASSNDPSVFVRRATDAYKNGSVDRAIEYALTANRLDPAHNAAARVIDLIRRDAARDTSRARSAAVAAGAAGTDEFGKAEKRAKDASKASGAEDLLAQVTADKEAAQLYRGAIAAAERTRAERHATAERHAEQARVLLSQKRLDDAESELTQAVAAEPDNPTAAALARQLSDTRRAAARESQSVRVTSLLEQSRGLDAAQAVPLLRQAAGLDPSRDDVKRELQRRTDELNARASASAGGSNAAGPAKDAAASARAMRESDLRAIQQVLESYRQAWDGRDVEAIQALYPSVNAKALRDQFKNVKSQRIGLQAQAPEIDPGGAAAIVRCRISSHVDLRAGSVPDADRDAVFRLEKTNGAWRIARVDFR